MSISMHTVLYRIWRKLNIKPAHVTALIVAVVSGLVLLAYKWVNPNKEAERHYLEHDNVIAYRTMEGCYLVILAAAAFNFRYLVFDVGKEAFALLAKATSLR